MCVQCDLIKATTNQKETLILVISVTQTVGRREMQITEDMALQTTCHQAAKRVHLRIRVGEEEISSLSLWLPILPAPSALSAQHSMP